MKKTVSTTKKWYLIDAENQVLGRVSPIIANLLRGKDKPSFVYNQDVGDYVVVINASKVILTGRKSEQKKYYHHSGYMGGLRTEKFSDKIKKHPEEVIQIAVKGMLPKNRLQQEWLKRLRIFPKDVHQYNAKELIKVNNQSK